MLPAESSYGVRKRLLFVAGILRSAVPQRVLDIGCGTGEQLTLPLARQFPDIHFVGVDSDPISIDHARRHNRLGNIEFRAAPALDGSLKFDLIIASEVIEHVEDPERFLLDLRSMLSPQGRVVLTLPNGYGPFELAELIRALLVVSGLYRLLRRAAVAPNARTKAQAVAADTLAVSPHINFFSHRAITRLIRRTGYDIERYVPRTLLCGLGFDRIISGERLVAWNARIVDGLPPAFASDWMFLLKRGTGTIEAGYRAGWYARLRRKLNFSSARAVS